MNNDSDFSLEKKLEELRALVEKMQKGVADFDKQVSLFKDGTQIIRECRAYLDQSELQVQQLISGELKNFEEE